MTIIKMRSYERFIKAFQGRFTENHLIRPIIVLNILIF